MPSASRSKTEHRIRYAFSRRTRYTIFALCLAAVVFLIWLDHSPAAQPVLTLPVSEAQISSRDTRKYHRRTFTVVNVVDGDTIDIDIPDGRYNHTRIRLWGVDTPETKDPGRAPMYFGREAAEFTTQLALGKSVTVYLDEGSRTRGKYGRLLAYIKLPDGRFLNEVLLTEGYAYADLRFAHSFYNTYTQLESAARAQKSGLWRSVTRDQLPGWLQREKPNLLKPK